MVEQYLWDNSTDTLFKLALDVKWIVYNNLYVGHYSNVHHDKISGVAGLPLFRLYSD